MTSRPLTRQESQARTRAQLLSTGEQVFLDKGYHAASIELIARSAGYTTGAVYSNFASKDELALAVVEQKVGRLILAIQAQLATAAPTISARLGAIETLLDTMLGEEEWIVFLAEFVLATRHRPAMRDQIVDRLDLGRQLLAGVLKEQHDQLGIDLSMEPERLAGALIGLAIGLAVMRLADPGIDAATFTQSATLMLRGTDAS
jgi:AcrR family transcriptional regulator